MHVGFAEQYYTFWGFVNFHDGSWRSCIGEPISDQKPNYVANVPDTDTISLSTSTSL